MHIAHLEIANFRKLLSVRIDLADKTTLFVGANNNGKTSAMLALRRFLAKRGRTFAKHDLTLCHWAGINALGQTWMTQRERERERENARTERSSQLRGPCCVPAVRSRARSRRLRQPPLLSDHRQPWPCRRRRAFSLWRKCRLETTSGSYPRRSCAKRERTGSGIPIARNPSQAAKVYGTSRRVTVERPFLPCVCASPMRHPSGASAGIRAPHVPVFGYQSRSDGKGMVVISAQRLRSCY